MVALVLLLVLVVAMVTIFAATEAPRVKSTPGTFDTYSATSSRRCCQTESLIGPNHVTR